jgi:hypothetical protein
MHREEADSSCRGATAGTSRAAHHHQWQRSPARPNSARVTTTFVAVTRHATSPRAPRDLVAHAVQRFAALDRSSGVRPSSARTGAPSPLSSSTATSPTVHSARVQVRACASAWEPLLSRSSVSAKGRLPPNGQASLRSRGASSCRRRSASATCRLTPRCSGQHPGIRPGVAAELIRR